MKNPVAINTGAQTDLGVKHKDIEIGDVDNDYRANNAGLTWYNSPDTSLYIIYANSNDIGFSGDSPIFWTCDKNYTDLLRIINGLPGRRGEIVFYDIIDALNWLNTSPYYFIQTGGQSFFTVVSIENSNNYFYSILDYETNTALLIDSNVYNNDIINGILPINNSGYAALYENSDYSGKIVYFLNPLGSVITEYGVTGANNWDWQAFDGVLVGVNDTTNGYYIFFNGTSVYNFVYGTIGDIVSILDYYDSVTSNKYALLKYITNDTNTVSIFLLNATNFQISGPLLEYDNSDDVIYQTSITSDFIVELTFTNSSNIYTRLRIIDPVNLNVKADEDLTTYGVTNYTSLFYGLNKFSIMLCKESDINVPYLVYDYNSTTDSLNQFTHARGTEYRDYNPYYSELQYTASFDRDMMVWAFYDSNYFYNESYFYYFPYLDLLPLGSTGSTPSFYTFANNQTVATHGFSYCLSTSAAFALVAVNNDYGVLTFKNDGTSHFEVLFSKNNVSQVIYDRFGDKIYVSPFLNFSSLQANDIASNTITILDKNGTKVDQFTFTGTTGEGTAPELISAWGDNNVLYAVNYSDQTTSLPGAYFNENNVFTSIDYYSGIFNSSRNYVSDTRKTNGHLVLTNIDRRKMRVINGLSVTTEIDLPSDLTGIGDVVVGTQNFILVYYGLDDLLKPIHLLYDFSGNLLQTLNVAATGNQTPFAIDTRMCAAVYDGNSLSNNRWTQYILTPRAIVQSASFNNIYYTTANDIEFHRNYN